QGLVPLTERVGAQLVSLHQLVTNLSFVIEPQRRGNKLVKSLMFRITNSGPGVKELVRTGKPKLESVLVPGIGITIDKPTHQISNLWRDKVLAINVVITEPEIHILEKVE